MFWKKRPVTQEQNNVQVIKEEIERRLQENAPRLKIAPDDMFAQGISCTLANILTFVDKEPRLNKDVDNEPKPSLQTARDQIVLLEKDAAEKWENNFANRDKPHDSLTYDRGYHGGIIAARILIDKLLLDVEKQESTGQLYAETIAEAKRLALLYKEGVQQNDAPPTPGQSTPPHTVHIHLHMPPGFEPFANQSS